ncbi:ComF family protein [Lichenifustis flavocetrariae]|uniref:ComF family protein n=1 Tax=Lichenifustis flavocetrariae TaxID=2949735 RepID=A0AA41Z1V2_9HYPH|nr:ComF family protein [Lichenifustis flavocetrariae]MCW6508948.1 ComF family protein [Lichenifustis flavocetrariae]
MADDGVGQIYVPVAGPVALPSRRAADRVGKSLAQAPLSFGRALLDLVYPPGCMACSGPTAASGGLCAACWTRLRFVTPPVCDRLGTPLPVDLGPGLLSPEALANPPVYRRARAVACFDEGPAQALVHRLKYGDRPDYARVLGLWMAQAGASLLDEADVVVPIPLHARRLWRRRFNQAAQLARSVSRAAKKPLDLDGLVRVKATLSQVGMTRAQRAENIQGAFRVAPAAAGRFRGRRVVLVDDVLTTGATVNAASRVLLRDGAATVDVLVFARVVTAG